MDRHCTCRSKCSQGYTALYFLMIVFAMTASAKGTLVILREKNAHYTNIIDYCDVRLRYGVLPAPLNESCVKRPQRKALCCIKLHTFFGAFKMLQAQLQMEHSAQIHIFYCTYKTFETLCTAASTMQTDLLCLQVVAQVVQRRVGTCVGRDAKEVGAWQPLMVAMESK
eukprot:scaffold175101_cov25-Tisochrysis_lutea.AAC.1